MHYFITYGDATCAMWLFHMVTTWLLQKVIMTATTLLHDNTWCSSDFVCKARDWKSTVIMHPPTCPSQSVIIIQQTINIICPVHSSMCDWFAFRLAIPLLRFFLTFPVHLLRPCGPLAPLFHFLLPVWCWSWTDLTLVHPSMTIIQALATAHCSQADSSVMWCWRWHRKALAIMKLKTWNDSANSLMIALTFELVNFWVGSADFHDSTNICTI